MSNDLWRSRPLIAVVLAGVVFSLGFGSASTAGKKVREGMRYFADGEFESAGKAFTEADVAEPDNETIAFDRGCAIAAAGDVEKARELFQQAAMARDIELAARSHYNLGSLSAALGRAALGDDPVAAPPEQRQEGLSLLLSAVQHYRDCLQLVADHSDARHNLELIRLFIKHIEAQWEARDREEAREEMGLLDFLSMIRQRQTALRGVAQALNNEADSPQRRQTTRETSENQIELQEEIEPLKAKIAEQLQAPPQAQPGPGNPDQGPAKSTQIEQAKNLLTELADEASSLMIEAGSAIEAGQFSDAHGRQRDVLDHLNQIFMAVAPFSNVLERATQQQDQLTATSETLTGANESGPIDKVEPPAEEEPDDKKPDDKRPDDEKPDDDKPDQEKPEQENLEQASADKATADADYPELQWRQTRVTDWSRMLSLKAKSELPGVEAQLQAAEPQEPAVDPSQATADDEPLNPQASGVDPGAQLEALKESLQKAIELAPQVEQHSSAAATNLGESDPAGALPEQRQAQELLRAIAEPLAQENQQQDNQPSDDGNEGDQNQEPEQPSPPPDHQEQPQTNQSPQESAMSTLRRARQRERQHRDLIKQLQQMIGGRAPVDRDW